MVFAAIATQILARTTRLLNGRKAVHMSGEKYMRAVVPIGLVYSASLVCSNMPYLYLSVAFIQMLKARPASPPQKTTQHRTGELTNLQPMRRQEALL